METDPMMRVKPGTLFDTGGYALSGKAYDLALSLTAKTTGEKIGSTVRSVVDAVDSGAAVNWLMGSLSSISTAAGEMLVDGSPLALDVLQALLAVRKAGGSTGPFDMFCYDWDTTRDWPCERYRFFVVQGGRILDAIVAFGDSGPGSFDRECFESNLAASGPPVWSHDRDWAVAEAAYWYRRFYREERRGQLMVLRPDDPPLHYFPEGRMEVENALFGRLESLERRLTRLYAPLVVAAAAALISAVLLWVR